MRGGLRKRDNVSFLHNFVVVVDVNRLELGVVMFRFYLVKFNEKLYILRKNWSVKNGKCWIL